MEQIEEQEVSITVEQSTAYITGATGKTLEVVSLTGKPVMKIKIESPAQRVELNLPKGCYILKIGKIVRKVSIR
ncbi:MAG: T9SS type A sorting domain-containing protein [Prevotella sp.]|nr:T9SS type A sorting domain-containing protein [Prevotella sp.]